MNLDAKKVDAYFKAYPNQDKLIFTADGFCFLPKDKDRAVEYAKSKKVKFETVDRPEADSKKGKKTEPIALTKEEAEEQLKTFELNKECDWDTIQALAKALEVEGKKKADYIEALTPIKEQLLNPKTEE